MLKDDEYNSLPHWEHLSMYIHRLTREATVEDDCDDEMDWAQSMIDDEDNWAWLRIEATVKSLLPSQVEALRERIRNTCTKSLNKRFPVHKFFCPMMKDICLVSVLPS